MKPANKNTSVGFSGNPTVLVVDDEELMREVVSIMIEENGGKVLAASDGQEAVEVFEKHVDEIDYVCMDFSMPRMNGYEAFVEMRRLKPDIGVVIVSGLSVTPEVDELRQSKAVEFLSKPFHESELMKVMLVLEERRG